MKKLYRFILLLLMAVMACNLTAKTNFVYVKDGRLWKGDKPYYYIGTNYWYGAILGSQGQGGNRERLCRELDEMKKMGIDNLRVLVGSDGAKGSICLVEPTLQKSPGIYNDTIFDGLDYLLQQMSKRKMVAVLYLNNAWEWSGGYGYYLEHAGCGKAPIPAIDGYDVYQKFVKQFATNEQAHALFYDHVRHVLGRSNRYTGQRYIDDPTIMSWQISNEPRAFGKDVLPEFEGWLSEASSLIRSLDPNHLISLGTEGTMGSEGDAEVFERISADPNIDYATIHLWPFNWGWTKKDSVEENVGRACQLTKAYIDKHLAICQRIGKPMMMEEFGYPRDGFSFSKTSSTRGRDRFYQYVLSMIGENAHTNGMFVGCNYWGWGGEANPRHVQWQVGDDYVCDPRQEQQGLNSVFLTDISTMKVIRRCVKKL